MSSLRIACVGDIMCGDAFSKIGWGAASCIDKHGRDFLPADIQRVLQTHDLVLGNVECVLSDVGRRENSLRSLHMRGRPRTVQYLAEWGLTAAHVANNHILEHGHDAARDTARHLTAAGIRVVGGGPGDSFNPGVTAVRIPVCGQGISMIGACFHSGKHAYCPGTLDQVAAAVETESGAGQRVLVSLHWGDELVDRPSLWQRDAARRLTEAGAMLVIGHHAHVFQGIDARDAKLVAYSLGNFIFDSDFDLTDWSAILSIGLSDAGVTDWEVIPVIRGEDYRPQIAAGARAESLRQEVARRNGLVAGALPNPNDYETIYRNEVKALDIQRRRELWRYLVTNLPRHRPVFWPQILLRPLQRRLGIW